MHFITFSRTLGSQGTEIARRVADELGYRFYDTAAISEAAKKMGFSEGTEDIDERVPSLFRRVFSHRPSTANARLSTVISTLAKEGDAVFVGRGSHLFLKAFDCTLHVRVTASKSRRIDTLIQRGYEEGAAVKAIENSDRERSAYLRYAFGVDWNAPELYDVTLNTDKVGVELAAAAIMTMARSDEIKARAAEALKTIEMLALQYNAEAAIIEAGLSYGLGTDVRVEAVEPGNVRLYGIVNEEPMKTRAESVLRTLKAVHEVDNQIRVRIADRHS
jgi:cytidylate kinase